jgi:hypothetical protein
MRGEGLRGGPGARRRPVRSGHARGVRPRAHASGLSPGGAGPRARRHLMLPAVHNITSTAGIVAIAAGAVAVLALLLCLTLLVRVRRLRADQRLILGDGSQDLVAHSAALRQHFEVLYEYVQDMATGLTSRMETAEHRLDQTIAYSALVRYDAYGEMSGRQSTSIALLDARRTGLVLSSIHHRDQARLYAKQVYEGQPEFELSPEENEAIRLALERGTASQARV